MILHSIGQFLALKFYEIGERFKHKPEMVSIFDQIRDASKVCIFAPNNNAELKKASIVLSNLNEIFPHAKGVIFILQDLTFENFDGVNYNIVKIDPQKQTLWGMPDKALKKQIKVEKFDVVLDLSISFSFENTSLAWHCNSPLRVSFNHPKREKLYNFIVRLKEQPDNSNAYKTIGSFLGIKNERTHLTL